MSRVRTHVMLPKELLERLDELVDKRKRSEFVAEALESALRRRELLAALDAVAGETDIPDIPEWDDVDAWIRESRRDRPDEWLKTGGYPE